MKSVTIPLAVLFIFHCGTIYASGEPAKDLDAAKKACRSERKWPEFPPQVEGCPVDWENPDSVSKYVVFPKRRPGPREGGEAHVRLVGRGGRGRNRNAEGAMSRVPKRIVLAGLN